MPVAGMRLFYNRNEGQHQKEMEKFPDRYFEKSIVTCHG
jgi:hypothetical protein